MRIRTRLFALCAALLIPASWSHAKEDDACEVLPLIDIVESLRTTRVGEPVSSGPAVASREEALRLVRVAERMLESGAGSADLPAAALIRYRLHLAQVAQEFDRDAIPATSPKTRTRSRAALSEDDRRTLDAWLKICERSRDRRDMPDLETTQPDVADTNLLPEAPASASNSEPHERRLAPLRELPSDSSMATGPLELGLALFVGIVLAGFAILSSRDRRRAGRAARILCRRYGRLTSSAINSVVVVVDISQLGCKIETDLALTPKSECRLKLLGKWVSGRVIWSNSHYLGLEFSEDLAANFVSAVADRAEASTSSAGGEPAVAARSAESVPNRHYSLIANDQGGLSHGRTL